MNRIIRRIDLREVPEEDYYQVLQREWLITNGLGGYGSGTISGTVTRRYHGLLIAALPDPLGRVMMLNHLAEFIRLPGGRLVQIGGEEPGRPGEGHRPGHFIREFRLENGMPIWRYEVEDFVLEKHILFLYRQNTIHVGYHQLSAQDGVRLELRPSMQFRSHDHAVNEGPHEGYRLLVMDNRYEVSAGESLPTLRMTVKNEHAAFTHDGGTWREIMYPHEADRGYQSRGALWSPGHFTIELQPRQEATLICSTETWLNLLALSPREVLNFYHARQEQLIASATPAARQSPGADLVLAADQFIIVPAGRLQDAARAHAAGDENRTIIAGYHWFTDWGRDTMISLEGLCLATKRYVEAGWVLRTFARYIRHGLIPNLFPEGRTEGLYHTADATLWFFHALDRYVKATGDRATLGFLLPKLVDILETHLRGTRFGIGVDPRDGLLRQGEPGYQLTWMDAKVGDWVVTPRRGKAIEINALWYNALRLVENWLREEKTDTDPGIFDEHARRAQESFNRRFWFAKGGYLYDVVDGEDGNDSACRPNQLLAFSLGYPVLERKYWEPVLQVVEQRLMTPLGLRSLSPDHPDYKPKYFGDLRARDAAYHQGTVWAWLIGPFVDAWLRVHPEDRAGARAIVEGLTSRLDEACVGTISEVFDAETPWTARGCVSQAWSVAEALRCWVLTAGPDSHPEEKTRRSSAPEPARSH